MKLTLTSCTAPVWGNEAHTSIHCTATFKEIGKPLPFTAMASDPEAHGQDLWKRLNAGEFGSIGAYVAPAPKPAPAGGSGPRVVG